VLDKSKIWSVSVSSARVAGAIYRAIGGWQMSPTPSSSERVELMMGGSDQAETPAE